MKQLFLFVIFIIIVQSIFTKKQPNKKIEYDKIHALMMNKLSFKDTESALNQLHKYKLDSIINYYKGREKSPLLHIIWDDGDNNNLIIFRALCIKQYLMDRGMCNTHLTYKKDLFCDYTHTETKNIIEIRIASVPLPNNVKKIGEIFYDEGSDTLDYVSKANLDAIFQALNFLIARGNKITVYVSLGCKNTTHSNSNVLRQTHVIDYLIEKGLSQSRIILCHTSEEADKEHSLLNRRVDIFFTEKNKNKLKL